MDLDKIWMAIGISALLLWFARASYSAGKSGARKLSRIALLSSVAYSFLALFAFMFVISIRVIGSEKDGLFGAAAGLILGVIMSNLGLSSHLMGLRSKGTDAEPPAGRPEGAGDEAHA